LVWLIAVALLSVHPPEYGYCDAALNPPKAHQFYRHIELSVPAYIPLKARPSELREIVFHLPGDFDVVREGPDHGLELVTANLERMERTRWEVQPIVNGIKLIVEVKNNQVAPVTGRTAHLTLRLKGIPKDPAAAEALQRPATYDQMRSRFLNDFYFSGVVAQEIWIAPDGPAGVKFADQTVYMGQALAVFATEMALLRRSGQPLDDPRAKIVEILDAFDRLDMDADAKYGGAAQLDGFFLRDNVIPNDDRLRGRFTFVESDGQHGNDVEMDTPSGDQIMGMLFGLWFVAHDSGDAELIERARSTARRIYDYAHRCQFELKRPDGVRLRRGAEFGWLATLAHGVQRSITGDNRFDEMEIKLAGAPLSKNTVGGFWGNPRTPDILSNFIGGNWQVLDGLNLPGLDLKSFTLHILLSATAIDDVFTDDQHEALAMKAGHPVSILMRSHRKQQAPGAIDPQTLQTTLEQCPAYGPAAYLNPQSPWRQDNRWVRCTSINQHTDGLSRYNGLDWLLLWNLMCLN
jgi:hypothetical protein